MSRSLDYLSDVLTGVRSMPLQLQSERPESRAHLSRSFDDLDPIAAAAWQEILTRALPGKRTPKHPFKRAGDSRTQQMAALPAPANGKVSEP